MEQSGIHGAGQEWSGRDLFRRRAREKDVVFHMIALYCKKRHRTKAGLCPECAGLKAYAWRRVDRCPNMGAKSFCSRCATPCYRPDMRERIREVMRFSGPRMLLYHPIMTARHLVLSLAGERKGAAKDPSSL